MRELASRAGVDVSVVSRAERGVGNLPRLSTVRKLAEGLDLSADERDDLFLLAGDTLGADSAGSFLLRKIRQLEERMDKMQARIERLENH